MARKRKMNKQSIAFAILWGTVIGAGILLLAAILIATLVASQRLEMNDVGYGSGIALFLGSFAGALMAINKAGQRRLLVALLTSCAIMLMLLCGNAVFFGGEFSGLGVTTLLMLGAGAVAALIRRPGSGLKRAKKFRI